jgi:hypothetical protein
LAWSVAAIFAPYYAVAAKPAGQPIRSPRYGKSMTSESDSTPRRRPPTIDLTATEVGTGKAASEPGGTGPQGSNSAGDRANRSFAARLRPHAFGALAGVLVTAALVAGLWLTGLWPSHTDLPETVAARPGDAAMDEITARLNKIEAELKARPADSGLGARLSVVEAQTKALGDSVAALARRADEIAATARDALTRANAAAAAADAAKNTGPGGVQRSDLEALAGRVAALERAVKTLADDSARRVPGADDRAARLTIAAEALRAAVERGVPYQAELAAVKSLGVSQGATAPLEPFARDGVPTAAQLAHELSQLVPALMAAAGDAPADGSFLSRLEDHAQKLVRVTPIDAPAGNEPSAVIARIEADAARGDIDAALADVARLPDPAKAVTAAWVEKANARNAAIAASRQIAAAAMAALGNPSTQ